MLRLTAHRCGLHVGIVAITGATVVSRLTCRATWCIVVVQEAKSSVSSAMSVIAELAAVTRACAAVSEWHCYRGVIFATRDVELAQRAQREMRQSRRRGRFLEQAPGGTMSYWDVFARSTRLKKTHTHICGAVLECTSLCSCCCWRTLLITCV